MSTINYLTVRNTVLPVVNATRMNYSTLTGSTITATSMNLTSASVALGASTNQTYTNFSNGSYAPPWITAKEALSGTNKTVMSANGLYQMIVGNATSGLFLSSDSGITWTALTGGLPTLTGSAYWSDGSISANGQYITLSIYGGSLWMSADYGRTFALTNQPTPTIWLPLNGNTTDLMGSSTVTVTGSPSYVTLNYPGYTAQAVNLANTAGGTATRYVRGTWTASDNFMVSLWFNTQSTGIQQVIFDSGNEIAIYINGDQQLNYQYVSNGTPITNILTASNTIVINTWYYVAVIFQKNGTCSMYLNNTLIGSSTNVGGYAPYPSVNQFSLGTYDTDTNLPFNGYIYNLRITNSVSTYVPIPLLQPNIWMPFENNTADLGSNAITPTVTGSLSYVPGVVGLNAVNLVNPPGGTPANYISGSWPALTVCTISGWFNIQSFSTTTNQFVCSLAAATGSIIVFIEYTSRKLYAQLGISQVFIGNALSLNTWYYFQLTVSSSSSATLYLNSDSVTFAYTAGASAGGGFSVGTYSGGGYAFNGYVDDLRIYNAAIPYHTLMPQNYRSLALSGTGQYALASAASGWVVGSSNSSQTWSKQAVCVGTQSDFIQPNITGLGANTWTANGVNWVVSASSTIANANYAPYAVFNNSYANVNPLGWADSGSSYNPTTGAYTGVVFTTIETIGNSYGVWIQLQSSIPLILNSYRFASAVTAANIPKVYYWVGSNDGTTWYPLHYASFTTTPITTAYTTSTTNLLVNYTGTQAVQGNQTGSGSTISYPTSTTPYTYFRLILNNIWGSNASVSEIGELYLNFVPPLTVSRPSASMLSLNHTGQYQLVATGPAAGSIMPNQTGLVTNTWSQGGVNWGVSASATNDGYAVYNVFSNSNTVGWIGNNVTQRYTNGATNGNAALTNIQTIGSTAGEWVQIQTSVPLVLTSFAFGIGPNAYPSTNTPKTYYIVGSNDGSTWVPLQFGNFTISAFTGASVFINMNTTGTQTLTSTMVGSVATTAYSFTTNAYTYFRLIGTSLMVYGGSSGTTYMEVGEWYMNFSNSVSYSSNYGATWLNTSRTVSNESVALSPSGQYALSTNSVAPFARLTLDNTNVDAQGVLAPTTGGTAPSYSTSIKAVGSHSAFFNQTAGSTTPSVYLNYIVPTVLNTPSVLTMSCWMYMSTMPASGISIPMSFSNTNNTVGGVSFFVFTSGSVIRFAYTATISGYAELSYNIQAVTNVWYHLVGVASAGVTQFYVNGTLIGSGTYSGLLCLTGGVNMSRLMVGAQYTSGQFAGAFHGYVDDVRLYTSALSADEVNSLYNNPAITQTIAVSNSYLPITSYAEPILPGITANVVDTAVSQTGQYMVAVTSSTTNNVYYSTDFGATFTALTIGSSAIVSCSISYDGTYLTVTNATTTYTLNRNTRGFALAIGNQAGRINQGLNAIAIGDKAGQTNQSNNSIVLNATGNALDAVAPGFYVAPIATTTSSSATSFSLLGYGTDNQVTQTNLTVLSNGNVGLGMTNPSFTLHTRVATYSAPVFVVDAGNQGADATSVPRGIGKPLIGIGANSWSNVSSGDYYGIGFGYNANLPVYYYAAEIGFLVQSTAGGEYGDIVFSTRPNSNGTVIATERMRIASAGNVSIVGNTSLGASVGNLATVLQLGQGGSAYYGRLVIYGQRANSNPDWTSTNFMIRYEVDATNFQFITINQTGVGIGVTGSGYSLQIGSDSAAKPSTNTWTISSDERLKENIILADIDRCVEIIRAVPLKHYRWKDEVYSLEQVKDRSKLGWIAQDVEKVFPKAVGTHSFRYNQVYEDVVKDGSKEKHLISEDVIEDCRDLNADQMYAVMYGAIQKLISENDVQKETNTELTQKLNTLSASHDALQAANAATSSQMAALLAWAQTQGFTL